MDTWRRGRRVHVERMRNESLPLDLFLERADKTPSALRAPPCSCQRAQRCRCPARCCTVSSTTRCCMSAWCWCMCRSTTRPSCRQAERIEVEKLGKGFYAVQVHHGFFETPDVPQRVGRSPRPMAWRMDIDTATFFIGRETLVPAEHPVLGSWRTWLYMMARWRALCRRRGSITCRPTAWSSWVPRFRFSPTRKPAPLDKRSPAASDAPDDRPLAPP